MCARRCYRDAALSHGGICVLLNCMTGVTATCKDADRNLHIEVNARLTVHEPQTFEHQWELAAIAYSRVASTKHYVNTP